VNYLDANFIAALHFNVASQTEAAERFEEVGSVHDPDSAGWRGVFQQGALGAHSLEPASLRYNFRKG